MALAVTYYFPILTEPANTILVLNNWLTTRSYITGYATYLRLMIRSYSPFPFSPDENSFGPC